MTPDPRPRLLLADAETPRRTATRTALSSVFTVAEAVRAEEVLAWLDQAEPGLTLLDHALPGAGGAELVARVRELYPDEIVLVVAPEPSVGLCRAAMRAGAYDCLDREALHPEQLRALCEAAMMRLGEGARQRSSASTGVRAAVRAHERDAASRLCSPGALAAWRAVDLAERSRWLDLWEQALQALDAQPERQRVLEELVEALRRYPQASELMLALHLHAAGSVRPSAREDAPERAREVLVEALQALGQRLAPLPTRVAEPAAPTSLQPSAALSPRGGSTPSAAQPTGAGLPASTPSARAEPARSPRDGEIPDLLWHRWCLAEGGEEWTLVGDGRPLARVSVVADACRAYIRDAENGGRVVAALLPPVPNGLREVERRLGLPPVLTVRSASVVA